jgi:hypothetical protein
VRRKDVRHARSAALHHHHHAPSPPRHRRRLAIGVEGRSLAARRATSSGDRR